MTELVIGPFSDFFFGKKNRRIVFKTLPGAPEDYVSLDPKRLLALYEKDGKFYALYSTEKEDYYNQFFFRAGRRRRKRSWCSRTTSARSAT